MDIVVQDGRNWARIEAEHHTHALFDIGEKGEWDSLFAAGPQVVAAGPKDMRLYYHSYDASCSCYAVGVATSVDGIRCGTIWALSYSRSVLVLWEHFAST
jgi:hypothetical protein